MLLLQRFCSHNFDLRVKRQKRLCKKKWNNALVLFNITLTHTLTHTCHEEDSRLCVNGLSFLSFSIIIVFKAAKWKKDTFTVLYKIRSTSFSRAQTLTYISDHFQLSWNWCFRYPHLKVIVKEHFQYIGQILCVKYSS